NVPMPKQFLLLNEKPIIVHTLEKFILNPRFDKKIVASPKEWNNYTQDILKKYDLYMSRITNVEDGAERNDTIISIIQYIETEYVVGDDDVLLHNDDVRPFLTHRIIEENKDRGIEHGAVDIVIEAIDTIVESQDNEFITNIPQRDIMYQGQTPQTFHIKKLEELYNSLTTDEKEILTDAC